jgi:hypothetical protein
MGLRVLREATQCSLTAKDGRMSLLLFLTHYIRYYGIKPQMTCVSRLTATTKAFSRPRRPFIPGVDSSSWYLKSDHDVIMKLSSVREGLPFELVSRHVKSHQDNERKYDDLIRPEQLRVS